MALHKNVSPAVLDSKGHLDWDRIRSEYLNENVEAFLDPAKKPLNYKDLAARYGLNYPSLRAKGSKEDWPSTLKKMCEDLSHKVKTSSIRLTLQSEIEIRTRQATYARSVMELAMRKLEDVDPKKMTVKEAADLLRLSADMERKALGLDGEYRPPPASNPVSGQTQEAVRQALQSISNLKSRLRLVQQDDQSNVA